MSGSAKIYGLTGGIASGKSTAARFFAQAGVAVLDADQIARELRAPGGAAEKSILKRFGTSDREKLRELVFKDAVARKDLEAILHPLIRLESEARIAALLRGAPGVVPVIYEATLLVETGRYRDFAGLIVVSAPLEARLQRLMARDKISSELAEKIMAAQISEEERRSHATWILENNGSEDELRERVRELASKLGG